MRTLYLECAMGAAGDMLTAALLELLDDRDGFLRQMNALGLPGVYVAAEPSVKCGVTGTHIRVEIHGEEEDSHAHHHDHEHHHSHSGLHDVAHVLEHLPVSDFVKQHALAVYQEIAQAESHVHGQPVEQIHFHEVGTLDAIADVIGVCVLIEKLAPEQILASAVHVGAGQVRCAHGLLPVPAPATAYLLRDVPMYGGAVQGELCTPTGAALLRHFVTKFGQMLPMRVEKIGYGMGKKEFPAANCVRAMLGETEGAPDEVVELCCNLDDMTPEALGFAQERLWQAGALDVYTTAVGMKKNRPGILLTCTCRENRREDVLHVLFRHTTTLGVREQRCKRYILSRSESVGQTNYGPVRVKQATGWGVSRSKPEYEDLAELARKNGVGLAEIELQDEAKPVV